METSRFFVANLPSNTKEKDLSRLFQDYGEVVRVELKTKENLAAENPEDVKIIAFVTVKISADDAHYCLDDLNWQKVNGAQIKVSLAKESFLDRLKREREEAEAAVASSTSTKSAADATENSSEFLTRNLENTRKKFAEDLDSGDDDDIAPDLLITKKRAASSLHNGKIVIQSYDTTPVHIIETKKHAKHLDTKSSSADQKRKESQNKMKTQYQQNKTAIQQALSGLDSSASKKIKFSDAESDDETTAVSDPKSKTNIFGSDDEGAEEDFDLALKDEHFGKKGEKLVQLQSHQSLDPRFKIDSKFVDDDDNEDEHAANTKAKISDVEDPDSERNWQMGILEQVVGTKIDTGNAAQKAAKNKKMLRFDPSKDDHQKLLRSKQEPVTSQVPKKKKKTTASEVDQVEESVTETPAVSKEVFYMVTDTLAQSLKTRGDGFSLLNMFGKGEEEFEQREDQLKKVSNEKILVNRLDKNALNPFSYDSSSDSDGETQTEKVQANDATTKQKQKVKVVVETFFIPKNDARLKEGAKFFKYSKKDASEENYEEVRNRLKMLIKTKITKTKKHLVSFNHKGKNKIA